MKVSSFFFYCFFILRIRYCRFCLLIPSAFAAFVILPSYKFKNDLDAVAIGRVTDDKMLRLLHKGQIVAEVPADALVEDAPVYHKPSAEPAYYAEFQAIENTEPAVTDYKETLNALLKAPTIASKEWVYRFTFSERIIHAFAVYCRRICSFRKGSIGHCSKKWSW